MIPDDDGTGWGEFFPFPPRGSRCGDTVWQDRFRWGKVYEEDRFIESVTAAAASANDTEGTNRDSRAASWVSQSPSMPFFSTER